MSIKQIRLILAKQSALRRAVNYSIAHAIKRADRAYANLVAYERYVFAYEQARITERRQSQTAWSD